MLLDRLAYALRGPRRGELVALLAPDGQLSVKRVVGLPGEMISIRQGDLYADGRLVRKSLVEFRRVATLVHDDAYRPGTFSEVPPRWSSDQHPTGWQRNQNGYRFTPLPRQGLATNAAHEGTIDELTYRNWRCYPTPHPRTEETPISDHQPFDQSESRQLWNVTDILIACRLQLDPSAQLQVRIHDGNHAVRLWLDAQLGEATLSGEDQMDGTRFAVPLREKLLLEFGLFDQQAVVAVDGKLLAQQPFGAASGVPTATARPFGFLGRDGTVQVTELRVYRDIFYLDPRNLGGVWETADHSRNTSEPTVETYFLLGDNPYVSADSRHWPGPGVPRGQLCGKVLLLR